MVAAKPLPKVFNAVFVIPDFFAPNAPPLTASIVEGAVAAVPATATVPNAGRYASPIAGLSCGVSSVSYTHLTLPTKRIV